MSTNSKLWVAGAWVVFGACSQNNSTTDSRENLIWNRALPDSNAWSVCGGIDSFGNVVVGALINGTVNFGGGSIGEADTQSLALACLSATDGHEIWAKAYEGDYGSEATLHCYVDGTGKIVASLSDTASDVDLGAGAEASPILASFAGDTGAVVWSQSLAEGDFSNHVGAIARDAVGDTLVTGYSVATVGPTAKVLWLHKRSSLGDLLWTYRHTQAAGEAAGEAVASLGSDRIVIAGTFEGALSLAANYDAAATAAVADQFVAAFVPPAGPFVWDKHLVSFALESSPIAVAIEPAEARVFVHGSFDAAGDTTDDAASRLVTTLATDAVGTTLWSDAVTGANAVEGSSAQVGALGIDSKGGAIAADTVLGEVVAQNLNISAVERFGMVIRKNDSATGDGSWVRLASSSGDMLAHQVLVDSNNKVVVVGTSKKRDAATPDLYHNEIFVLKMQP